MNASLTNKVPMPSDRPVRDRLRPYGPVAFTMLTRGWGVVSTAVTIVVLIWLVSPTVQGYYYGFLSLMLLQQLLGAGLSIVLLQFVSHEWLSLRLERGVVVGEELPRLRLASLVRVSERGFVLVALGVFLLLTVAGPLLFGGRDDPGIDWLVPWLLVSLATSAAVLLQPMSTTLEATGQVDVQQRAIFLGNVVGSVAGWIALLAGWGLFAIAVIVAVRTLVTAVLLFQPYRPFRRLAEVPSSASIPFREIWRLQWRVTFSWLFGLIIYQSVVPIAFRVEGPVAAGELGVMVQGFHAILSLAGAWLVPAQPEMGRRAAAGDLDGLRRLTDRTSVRCAATALAVGGLGFGAVLLVDMVAPAWGRRFGDLFGLLVLFVVAVILQPALVMSSAVRFQKKEPFLTMGLVCSLVTILLVTAGARWLGLSGIVLGFAATISFVVIPWTVLIYLRETAGPRSLATI